MITNPVDRVRVYDTINALLLGKSISRKEKHRLAHRLILSLGDGKKKAREKCEA